MLLQDSDYPSGYLKFMIKDHVKHVYGKLKSEISEEGHGVQPWQFVILAL